MASFVPMVFKKTGDSGEGFVSCMHSGMKGETTER